MKITDKTPGEKVTIAEGPAQGREVRLIMKTPNFAVIHDGSDGQTVRGDLEVE